MPLTVTKNFIHVPSGTPDYAFQKSFGRIITVDKSRGIKGTLRKLKGTGKTRISSYLFPTEKFTKTQAKDWVKAHKEEAETMETNVEDVELDDEMTETVWTTAYVNTLPDSAFLHIKPGGEKDSEGKTKPRSLRMFPYKDKGGKVDLPHLRNALGRIPQSSLDQATKNRVAAKARRLAKSAGIDVSEEEFLDEENSRWPITYPEIFETVIAFNKGTLYECGYYGWDQVNTYGRRLARKLTQMTHTTVNDDEYDEEGRPTSSKYWQDGQTLTTYRFHDGQIVAVRSRGDSNNQMDWEYVDEGEEEPEETIAEEDTTFEAYAHVGEAIKYLRRKKKKSRLWMASEMNMTAARLKEIEDDGDADEKELDEIARALKMSKKKLKGMMTVDMPPDSSQISGGEEIEIEDLEIEEIELQESPIEVYESLQEINYNDKTITSHRLGGALLIESKRDDGTIKFTVPMIKIDALTANGNRYSLKCCENIIKDIKLLQESHSRRDGEAEQERLSILHINSPKTEKEKPPTPTMLPTHGARINEALGNPLLSIAGIVTGAHFNEEKSILFIEGETLPTTSGKDMGVLIDRKLIKGVSLAATPVKNMYEKNDNGGYDVDRIHFLGSDFTNNPAMPFEADEAGFKLAA